jgi:uncharacterized protein (TIGR02145 family)
VAGLYTYIRQAKSADCEVWQSSNEFAVTVFNCSFTAGTATSATATFVDPRDGKRYKTVVMPDGKTWFAQNLNYTKDLTYNAYAYEANGKQIRSATNGVSAIGSYWCPAVDSSVVSGTEADCRTYGALYTWETAMMVDGKYADDTKASSAWDESWVSGNYYTSGAPGTEVSAGVNNARGGRGICPMGWHVPTVLEWAVLLDAIESSASFTYNLVLGEYRGVTVGLALKSASTYTGIDLGTGAWLASEWQGTDTFGFNAVPAGNCGGNNPYGAASRGTLAYFHCSTLRYITHTYSIKLITSSPGVEFRPHTRWMGASVRCQKN